jgi:hypothetical protein
MEAIAPKKLIIYKHLIYNGCRRKPLVNLVFVDKVFWDYSGQQEKVP